MKILNFFLFRTLCKVCLSTGLITLFGLSALQAQTPERLTIEYQQFADADQVSVSGFAGNVAHRFFLDDDGGSLLTLSLGASQLELTDTSLTEPDRNRQLTAITPEFNLLRILDEDYSLIVSVRPGFFGDFSGSVSDTFRLEGGFVVTRLVNDHLTIGLGIGRGTNFGRDLVVPLLQFLYFATDKILIRGLLPVSASVWYIPSQTWEFGLLYKLQGSMYDLGETNVEGAQRLGFATAHVGLGARYNLFGNNFLTAEAGYAAQRRYEWDDRRGTSFDIGQNPFFEKDLGPVPYASLGFMQKF